jgi:hypothetical protein
MNGSRRRLAERGAARRAALALAAFLVACGNVSIPSGGGGSSSGGSGSGSGGSSGGGGASGSSSGGTSASCPATPPANGSSCTSPSVTCEYGGDPDSQCNTIAMCIEVTGRWSRTDPPSGGACPTSPPGTNGCPSSYSAVSIGQGCTSSAECAYPQGRCACTPQQGGPVEIEDAGSTWGCTAPSAGCPLTRPQAGSSCNTDGEYCDYGTCTLPGGTGMTCTQRVWNIEPGACAETFRPDLR